MPLRRTAEQDFEEQIGQRGQVGHPLAHQRDGTAARLQIKHLKGATECFLRVPILALPAPRTLVLQRPDLAIQFGRVYKL